MSKLHQGDELLLPIKIKNGNTYVTPSNVDDVRIQVEGILKSYILGQLTYENNTWFFPLTEEQTRARKNQYTDVQVGIKVGTTITYSDVLQLEIDKSIIVKEW